MGIIVRPNKPSGGPDWVAGDDALAANFNGDANTIYNEFNGNTDNANIKALAGIEGTKIATAPNGIPTDRINDSAVASAKIADGAIIAAKIPTASIIKGKLKLVEVTEAFSVVVVAGSNKIVTVTPGAALPLMANMLPISLTVEGVNSNTEAIAGLRKTGAGATVYTLSVYNAVGTSATGTIRLIYLDIA